MPGGKKRGLLGRIWEAITNPESYAPPPTTPRPPLARVKPTPPPAPKQERRGLFGFGRRKPLRKEPAPPPRTAPKRPPLTQPKRPDSQFTRTRFIPNSELPPEWRGNKRALWQDATKSDNRIGYDPVAQAYYDAVLYTRSENPQERQEMLDVFKQYIWQTYGVDWDDIFDWADYRANYDIA